MSHYLRISACLLMLFSLSNVHPMKQDKVKVVRRGGPALATDRVQIVRRPQEHSQAIPVSELPNPSPSTVVSYIHPTVHIPSGKSYTLIAPSSKRTQELIEMACSEGNDIRATKIFKDYLNAVNTYLKKITTKAQRDTHKKIFVVPINKMKATIAKAKDTHTVISEGMEALKRIEAQVQLRQEIMAPSIPEKGITSRSKARTKALLKQYKVDNIRSGLPLQLTEEKEEKEHTPTSKPSFEIYEEKEA